VKRASRSGLEALNGDDDSSAVMAFAWRNPEKEWPEIGFIVQYSTVSPPYSSYGSIAVFTIGNLSKTFSAHTKLHRSLFD